MRVAFAKTLPENDVLLHVQGELLHAFLPPGLEPFPRAVPRLLPRDLLLDLARGVRAGELEPLELGPWVGDAGDLADLGPGDLALAEGLLHGRELFELGGEEHLPSRGLHALQVIDRPLGGVIPGLVDVPALHVEKVEADRPLGNLALAVVEMKTLDDLLRGKTVD